MPNAKRLIVSALLCVFFSPLSSAQEGSLPGAVYSAGGWSTLHQGPGNRKQVRGVALADHYRSITVLAGSSVLTAPVVSPDGDVFYVTTGQGEGYSNLHAFTLEGELRWASPPVDSRASGLEAGVDGCAILSSPIVDASGDIYLSDCDQVWAFSPDGDVKWVVEQPEPVAAAWRPAANRRINAFTTATFTPQGHVFGITNYGDVRVLDRDTGVQLNAPQVLPGLQPGPSAVPLPKTMLGEGLMDPELRIWAWQLLMGGAMPSANTPAIDLALSRAYVAVSALQPGLGALLALDIDERGGNAAYPVEVAIAWSTEMGPGSGSSPSLSPDGEQVYVSDEAGMFYGVETRSGNVLWTLETASAAASVAVGADGVVYSLQQYAPAIVAMSAEGERLWESDVSELVQARLGAHWLFGQPVGSGSGNPTILDGELLVPIMYGYQFALGQRRLPLYAESWVTALDPATGKALRDVVRLPDDSSGITTVLPDGTILSSLGGVVTSSLRPLRGALNWLMPADHALLQVSGGVNIARPVRQQP